MKIKISTLETGECGPAVLYIAAMSWLFKALVPLSVLSHFLAVKFLKLERVAWQRFWTGNFGAERQGNELGNYLH